MNISRFDNKCVRITTVWGEVFEGIVSYDGREYALSEYGRDEEALHLVPIVFYKSDIADIVSLEDVDGPFGHFSEKYGLLEKKCLEWGTDFMDEVFYSEDDIQILRLLTCMNDNFNSLADRAVPGPAAWRSGAGIPKTEDDENEQGPIYLGELENMLDNLVKYRDNVEIVETAKDLLTRITEYFSCKGTECGDDS